MRNEIILNREWKFAYGEQYGAELHDFDDSSWYNIGIPHTFTLPYYEINSFYVGDGWYRKKLIATKEMLRGRILLEFGAVFQHAMVYINGKLVNEHLGGYTAFYTDVTDILKEGENLLAVKVDNYWRADLAPRSGEHTFCGGIYRDVKLILTNDLHVTWYGTFIHTENVSSDSADLIVETEIKNDTENVRNFTVETEIFDKNSNSVLTLSENHSLSSNETKNFIAKGIISSPDLWHPDHPDLYLAKTKIIENGQVTDEYETVFGIRYFVFTKKEGFFLNGEHYLIDGANVHQDHGGWGDAVTHAGIYRDIKLVKDCGFNFIRGSHYPHHTVFAEECDKQGLLFWSELCFWGTGGPDIDGYWTASAYPINEKDEPEFEKSCFQTLDAMIRLNRNHPSIVIWSMANEPFFTSPHTVDKAKDLLRRLVDFAHAKDPSRPAGVGGTQRGGFDTIGDVSGYNGDGGILFKDPPLPNVLSEYGSIFSDRPGKYGFRFREGAEDIHPWRSGRSLWCAFHHGSILKMSNMGIIDLFRIPMREWYCYREYFRGIPPIEWPKKGAPHHLKLTAERTVMKNDGTEDTQIFVTMRDENDVHIDAGDTVTLRVIEGPGIFPTGKEYVLDKEHKTFIEGLGAIEFRSYYAGKTVIEAVCDSALPATLELETTGNEIFEGQDEVPSKEPYVYVYKLDKKDHIVNKNRPVFVSSEEAGHERLYISDMSNDTYWCPAKDDKSPRVTQDLEQPCDVSAIRIIFREKVTTALTIELLENGNVTETIYEGHFDGIEFLLDFINKNTSSINIKFNAPVSIKHLMVFGG